MKRTALVVLALVGGVAIGALSIPVWMLGVYFGWW